MYLLVRNSIDKLLDQFPYFLNKSTGSNFYKSEWVFNEWFKETYNDLFKSYCGHKLSKPLLVWKTQEKDSEYTMHFTVLLPNLKTVVIYKNGVELYRVEYGYEDNQNSFYHNILDTCDEIISEDSYLLYAESYNEYNLSKGFPENDPTDYISINETIMGDLGRKLQISTNVPDVQEVVVKCNGEVLYNRHDNLNETIIIPQPHINETYYVKATTSNPLIFYEKRWSKQDSYSHDNSLDELGVFYSMLRKQYSYTHHTEWVNTYYTSTEPSYNNRYTEDDYHYMNRMITYITLYHTTPLPVLELWKLFGITATMENRNDLLCKMYEEKLHDPNWKPSDDFTHKNLQYVGQDEKTYLLYASVDNTTPFEGVPVTFDLTLYDEFFDLVSMTGSVEVYERSGEQLTLKDTISGNKWVLDTDDLSNNVHAYIFRYYPTGETDFIESNEILIRIKGCDDADIYVSIYGDDNNNGSKENPVKTVAKAVSLVEDDKNLIFLNKGEYKLSNTLSILKSCTIAHCHDGLANIVSPRKELYNISPNTVLNIVSVDSWFNNALYRASMDIHSNNSKTGLNHYVTVNTGNTRTPVTITVLTKKCRVGSECILKGVIKTNTGTAVSGKEVTISMNNQKYTGTTDSNGEFNISLGVLSNLGEVHVDVSTETDPDYKYCSVSEKFIVKKYNTILTADIDKTSVKIGETYNINGKLVDEDNTPLTGFKVTDPYLGIEVTTDNKGEWSYSGTSDVAGVVNFNFTVNMQNTGYNTPFTAKLSVTVNKLDTILTVTTDKTTYKVGATVNGSGVLKTSTGTVITGASVTVNGVTKTTDSNGEFKWTETASTTGNVSREVSYDGDNKYNNCTGTVSWTVIEKNTTQFNIDYINIQYIEDTNRVSVTLFDSVNNTPITGVNISDGTSTQTTNNNGQAIFTYTNTVTGDITKTYTYTGDSEYAGTTKTITWTINKRFVDLTLSSDKTTVEVNKEVTFTGVLTDRRKNVGIGGATVLLVKPTTVIGGQDTVIASVTTDVDGSFSKSVTFSDVGEHTVRVKMPETDVYIGGDFESVVVNVIEPVVTPEIIIGADTLIGEVGEDLLIQLQSNLKNTALTVLLNDAEIVDSVTTDNAGNAVFNYNCNGAGDVEVKVKYLNGTNVYYSNILTVEDCVKCGFKSSDTWINPTGHSSTNNTSNGVFSSTSNSNEGDSILQLDLTGDFIITYGAQWQSSTRCGIGAKDTTRTTHFDSGTDTNFKTQKYIYWNGTKETETHYSETTETGYCPCKIIKQNGHLKGYMHDTLVCDLNYAWISQCSAWNLHTTIWGSGRTINIKNLKIKPYSE